MDELDPCSEGQSESSAPNPNLLLVVCDVPPKNQRMKLAKFGDEDLKHYSPLISTPD